MQRTKSINASELSALCMQIGTFLRSGITLADGLDMLRDERASRRVRSAVNILAAAVSGGKSLSKAMTESGAFPDYLIKMTEAGEASGNLDGVMASMSRFYAREHELRERIRAAILYPILMVVMMGAVVFFLVIKVLPMFSDILSELGGDMPAVVSAMMGMGTFFAQNWIVLLSVLAAIVLLCWIFGRTKPGAYFFGRCKMTLPLLRSLYSKIAAERFASAMSFLVAGGVDMETALDISGDVPGNPYLSEQLKDCRKQNVPLYDSLCAANVFPAKFTKTLTVGFRSGEVDTALAALAETYGSEADRSLNRAAGSIEPILTAVLSVIVGAILVSVILPLIRIMSLIG